MKTIQFPLAISLVFLFSISCVTNIKAQQETEQQKAMARQMAEWMDQAWDQQPEEGMANLRFLLTKDGKPYKGPISIHTEFSFRANGHGTTFSQGFNTNTNGRWVYEGIEPGTYNLIIEGTGNFAGWTWKKENVTFKAGESTLFEIKL